MTGTAVSRLTCAFDNDNCSRMVSSIGPMDVIAGRILMEIAKIAIIMRTVFRFFTFVDILNSLSFRHLEPLFAKKLHLFTNKHTISQDLLATI